MSLSELDWLAQGIGIAAFLISLVGYVSVNDRRLRVMMTSGTVLLTIQYLLFGGWLVAVSLAMNTARTWLSIYRKGWRWFLLVAGLQVLISLPMMHSARDVFPVVGSLIGSFGLLCLDGVRLRIALLLTTACWTVNNLLWGSIGGLLLDGLNSIAHLVAIFRIRRDAARRRDLASLR